MLCFHHTQFLELSRTAVCLQWRTHTVFLSAGHHLLIRMGGLSNTLSLFVPRRGTGMTWSTRARSRVSVSSVQSVLKSRFAALECLSVEMASQISGVRGTSVDSCFVVVSSRFSPAEAAGQLRRTILRVGNHRYQHHHSWSGTTHHVHPDCDSRDLCR